MSAFSLVGMLVVLYMHGPCFVCASFLSTTRFNCQYVGNTSVFHAQGGQLVLCVVGVWGIEQRRCLGCRCWPVSLYVWSQSGHSHMQYWNYRAEQLLPRS